MASKQDTNEAESSGGTDAMPTTLLRAEIATSEEREAPSWNPEYYIRFKQFSFGFNQRRVLSDLNIHFPRNSVTALIGPSGCGKSTLLRCINRMNDLTHGFYFAGDIEIAGRNVMHEEQNVIALRRRVGIVFQESHPFAKSIYDNVAYGLRIVGVRDKRVLDDAVEKSLKRTALWDDVKRRLHESAMTLSVGERQRLCIARTLATDPEILLMDEPCSALDPVATTRVEELINSLKQRYTIIIVTHNLQQAARISDRTAFFYDGGLVEYQSTEDIFMNPQDPRTESYVSGRFG
ncbi:MAG: phosphate ABC transporter ATP-binding protein PstB [Opitutales bacterium]|nr:phosphate ABC transporter ATP-binding protein PstB [Opitutales bacterium]